MIERRHVGADISHPAVAMMVRAAQYVRMSTEHQQYSTENEADAIQRYAERRGVVVVRNRFLRDFYPTVVANTIEEIKRIGGEVEQDAGNDLLTVNREFTASIVISVCRQQLRDSQNGFVIGGFLAHRSP